MQFTLSRPTSGTTGLLQIREPLATITAAVAIALGCPAHAQPKAPQAAVVVTSEAGRATAVAIAEATATVVAINQASRIVTLKGANGRTLDVLCGDEVKNFAQIHVGDDVKMSYREALTLQLKKTRAPLAAAATSATVSAAPGSQPAAASGTEATVLADVVNVDPANSIISLKGPAGNVIDLKVQNPDHFKVVKKGDQVEAVYKQAAAIAVVPVAKKRDGKK